jgi:hypothetical protein
MGPNRAAAYFEVAKPNTCTSGKEPHLENYLVRRLLPSFIASWCRVHPTSNYLLLTTNHGSYSQASCKQAIHQYRTSDAIASTTFRIWFHSWGMLSVSLACVNIIAKLKADVSTRISKKNTSLWFRKPWHRFSWITEYVSHKTVGLTLIRLKFSHCKTIKFRIKRY